MSKGHTERIAAVGEAIAGIIDADRIFESLVLSWETKYHLIFKTHSTSVYPNLKALGIDFTWYNPDGDYDEDTRAYITAARKLLEALKAVQVVLTGSSE